MPDAGLYALFDRLPRPSADAVRAKFGDEAQVEAQGPLVEVTVGERTVRATLIDAPLPSEEVERSLPLAHLGADQKRRLRQHSAHAVIVADGESDAASLFMLYALADSLDSAALIGVLNPATCMALDGEMLAETLTDEFIDAYLEHPAASLGLWLGFVKLFKPDGGAWLVTRGAGLVDLPDLAYLVPSLDDTNEIYDMFVSILDYVADSGAELSVGHTMDFGSSRLRLLRPYEYEDMIGEHTLVIERIEHVEPS